MGEVCMGECRCPFLIVGELLKELSLSLSLSFSMTMSGNRPLCKHIFPSAKTNSTIAVFIVRKGWNGLNSNNDIGDSEYSPETGERFRFVPGLSGWLRTNPPPPPMNPALVG